MNLDDLKRKPLPVIPRYIQTRLECSTITLTPFEEKNTILKDSSLQQEIGYRRFSDGSYLVSMTCPMPGITPEMIAWWFWWHPQADERYQVWFPGEHFGIYYNKKTRDYSSKPSVPAFQPNTHYPTERIGGVRMPLRIDFVTPEQFGFSKKVMEENQISLIICGHVSAFRGLVPHTEMAHIFRQTDDGLYLISRFWLGKTLKNPLLRRVILTKETARDMAKHCCVEYRNLAEMLPELYKEFATK